MRGDRRRMEQEQRKLKKNGVYRTIAVIYAILALAFTAMLLWLNVLPAKILYPVVALLIVISLFIVPVMYSKRGKSGRKKGAAVFAVALILLFGVGTYYISETIGFFNSITDIVKAKEDFYLVVKAESQYEEASELKGKTIATSSDTGKTYSEARNKLKDEIDAKYDYIDDASEMIESLLQNKYSAVFISAASYDTMKRGQRVYRDRY